MNKAKIDLLLTEMKQTIRHYRDAKLNADGYYTEGMIENNMMQYFTGLKFSMELATGLIWGFSNNEEHGFCVYCICKDERVLYYPVN